MGDDGERMQELALMVEQVFPTPQNQPTSEVAPKEGKETETIEEQAGDVNEEPMETT